MPTSRTGQPVVIADPDPRWSAGFETQRARLAEVLPAGARVEHVGSTSVPGLGAKPIVDILVGVERLADVERCIPEIEALGYEYVPEYEADLPQRRYFRRDEAGARAQHLHAVELDSDFFRDHLAFRDALRADANLARAYETLKRELAGRFGRDREGYTDAKTVFVEAVLEKVRG
jgi:GrpB-like predicted nucleotidyltransferase (UPF0157 family)